MSVLLPAVLTVLAAWSLRSPGVRAACLLLAAAGASAAGYAPAVLAAVAAVPAGTLGLAAVLHRYVIPARHWRTA